VKVDFYFAMVDHFEGRDETPSEKGVAATPCQLGGTVAVTLPTILAMLSPERFHQAMSDSTKYTSCKGSG